MRENLDKKEVELWNYRVGKGRKFREKDIDKGKREFVRCCID